MAATTFADVIVNHFLTQVEDARIEHEIQNDPARAFWRLSRYMANAVAMFTRPPSMAQMLAYTDAQSANYVYTSSIAQAGPISVSTGLTGYSLCSAVQYGSETPVLVNYDAATGEVTIQEALSAGQQVDIDFYTDGTFAYELDNEQQTLLGKCMAVSWFSKISNNYLDLVMKIRDKSFDTASESAHMTAGSVRLKFNKNDLSDELLAYEQRVAYRDQMPITQWLKPPNQPG